MWKLVKVKRVYDGPGLKFPQISGGSVSVHHGKEIACLNLNAFIHLLESVYEDLTFQGTEPINVSCYIVTSVPLALRHSGCDSKHSLLGKGPPFGNQMSFFS